MGTRQGHEKMIIMILSIVLQGLIGTNYSGGGTRLSVKTRIIHHSIDVSKEQINN